MELARIPCVRRPWISSSAAGNRSTRRSCRTQKPEEKRWQIMEDRRRSTGETAAYRRSALSWHQWQYGHDGVQACTRAKVTNFRFHDLRHTFGSYLAMAGYNQRTIQELIGHKDPRMTVIYTQLSEQHKRQAVEGFDEILGTNDS
jgi:integrase